MSNGYYVTSCTSALCAGGEELLESPGDFAPCPWCGALAAVTKVAWDDRARARFDAKAKGLGFVQNAKGTTLLGGAGDE